jgi:predicted esterase
MTPPFPPPAGSWNQIEPFARSYWAFQRWGSAGKAREIAAAVRRGWEEGALPDSLADLRTALFLEREDLAFARALVEKIRGLWPGFHRRGGVPIFLPDVEGPRPCVVFLHGVGENGTDGERHLKVGLGPHVGPDFPAIALFPQCRGPWKYVGEDERLVLDALARAKREFPIDRVYLTGLSQGGCSTYDLGAKHPDLWDALLVVCGAGRPEDAPRLPMPVWAFHGGKDESIPPAGPFRDAIGSRDFVKLLPNARYTEFPDAGHAIWDRVYSDPEVWKWLFAQRRMR